MVQELSGVNDDLGSLLRRAYPNKFPASWKGEATSSSLFQGRSRGDEDIATPFKWS